MSTAKNRILYKTYVCSNIHVYYFVVIVYIIFFSFKDYIEQRDLGVDTDRTNLLKEICTKKKTISNIVSDVIGTRDGRLSVCAIPKAACTSWKRIIRFINGEKNKLITSPFDISKHETHYKRTHYVLAYSYDNITHKNIIENSTRVINARDPYTRVWSAYIDKFLLPDFWKVKGIRIIKHFRENPSNKSLFCGHDVTFSEFVEYVVSMDGQPFEKVNNVHWYPASTVCDPCLFMPNFVAKQETFSKDVHHILDSLDYSVFQNATKKHNMDTFEMLDQVDYVASIYGETTKKCITDQDLLSRLWTAFQYNGYLPIRAKFPEDKLNIMDKKSVSKIMENAYNDWKVPKAQKKAQKRNVMVNAYRFLPLTTLRKFQQMFLYDFMLFDYDIEPSEIFSGKDV